VKGGIILDDCRISDMITALEELKSNYGNVRVMIRSTYGEKDFFNEIFIGQNKNEIVAEIWS
jgi:hypothetical protein